MENYKVKLKNIKAFAFDVDGVLTDGQVICLPDSGELVRSYDAKDGYGLRVALINGYIIAIITGGEGNSIIKRFLPNLATDVFTRSRDKIPVFEEFCNKYKLHPSEVAYVGDDIPDIPVLLKCGLAVCPADACDEVKEVCDYVSIKNGGHGCARDLVEQVLKIQGKWKSDPKKYKEWREQKDLEFKQLYTKKRDE